MPNIVPATRYYPRLSEIITVEDLPEFLSFVQDGLNAIFDKIHYKNLKYSKSVRGDAAFYSLDIVTKNGIRIPLPGGMAFILNPDPDGDPNISSFPITLEYQWEILAFLKTFSLDGFSFSVEDFYTLGLQVFRVTEDQVLAHIINNFVVPDDENTTKYQQLISDINDYLQQEGAPELVIPSGAEESIATLMTALKQRADIDKGISLFLFFIYIASSDISVTKERLQKFYNIMVPGGIEDYIKKIIIPKAKATLALTAAIEFPASILKPVAPDGTLLPGTTRFIFAEAQLYADTESGIGYQLELGGSLVPTTAEIGNSGLLLTIDSLKLDLSKKTNIPEADADGRPDDFTGVYARAIAVTLPSRWFHDDALQGTASTTLRLGGYDLLIGTGGVSGTFMLETVPVLNIGGTPYYFEDKFDIVYPIVLLQKDNSTNTIIETTVNDIIELRQKLFPQSGPTATIPPYSFKFPLSIKLMPLSTGEALTFTTAASYQEYLNSFSPPGAPADSIPTLWKKIGSESNGFRVGFSKFDITFKQNKVVYSDIKGALEIKKFVYPADTVVNGVNVGGHQVHIDITGHLDDNGDFNLTASTEPPYPIVYPDVFTYSIKTLELGKQGNDYYIGTSGKLQFEGFLKEILNIGYIDIDRLRIYSDGSIELEGGSINLIEPMVLPIGPVDITVTAIHYGSHQKEVDGIMRKFNYFGFDGGVSVDPFGIEIRGDGVKYYYCVDDVEGHAKPKPYLHIQTLYLDLTIPTSSPVAIINGWLSIPEPGISKEYAGGIKIQLPQAKITGSADMKLMPKYPAFIIDAEIEFPVPIPLGTFAIYGFRGLLGYRYVAEKEAIGLVSGVNTWYEYYTAPQRGINIRKFNGPDKTKESGTPVSIGAGASLGTSFDNGTVLNIKAMVLLSIPSLFMLDGRAALISARLELEDTKDPPFFAAVAIGDDSLELIFGADFKMPTKSGNILTIKGSVQAGFFFKNQRPWYVNVGTKTDPIQARILTIVSIKSYVMLSAKGIEAGARGDFNFQKSFGPIKISVSAFIEIGGKVSFERPQIGGYLKAGLEAKLRLFGFKFTITVGVMFGVESPRPFVIFGSLYYRVSFRILGKKIRKSGTINIVWNFNKSIDRTPISPLLSADNSKPIEDLVKGINMLSNEAFDLAYIGMGDINFNTFHSEVLEKIVPLDTYIDIKTEKGLLPSDAVKLLIGGYTSPAQSYTDLIPPDKYVQGKPMSQVIHQYSIENIAIKSWNPAKEGIAGKWVDYHPYKALYPSDSAIGTMKIGQFQKNDGQYNTVRILATTPFSYTEQGQPGWFIPEQYGITPTTLFCQGHYLLEKYASFLYMPLDQQYQCIDDNNLLFSNDVAFMLLNAYDDEFAYISDENNSFGFAQSLSFNNANSIQILLPKPSVLVNFKLSNFSLGLKIKYYSQLINDNTFMANFGNPNPNASNPNEPFEILLDPGDLNIPISYNHPEWLPISQIVIEPLFDSTLAQQIATITEQIEVINNNNILIALGQSDGEIVSTESLENLLHDLVCSGTTIGSFINRYTKVNDFYYDYSKEFIENGISFIFSIGIYGGKEGLISKIDINGNIIWEKSCNIGPFKKIIQLGASNQYIVHAINNSRDENFLVSIDSNTGNILWKKQILSLEANAIIHIIESKTDTDFYMTISYEDRNAASVHKINALGQYVESKLLNVDAEVFTITALHTDNNGIVLAVNSTTADMHPTIIRWDSNRNILPDSILLTNPGSRIDDIKTIHNNRFYLISGYDKKEGNIFVSIVTGPGETQIYMFPNTNDQKTLLQLTQGGFYLLQYSEGSTVNGILHKMDFELRIIWTKQIKLGDVENNGIKNFTFNTTTEKITLNAYSQTLGSLVSYTNKDLRSCLTHDLQKPELVRSYRTFTGLEIHMEKIDMAVLDIDVSIRPLNSQKKELCITTTNSCGEKDNSICSVYETILSIYTNSFAVEDKDYTVYIGPANEILDNIDGSLNLINVLEVSSYYDTIKTITNFEGSFSHEQYITVIQAITDLLTYLNSTGNCVCECDPKNYTLIHEVSWLSLEDYQYNLHIPLQSAISQDTKLTVDAINKYIQPVWRPDTSYLIHFELKDFVDNGIGQAPGAGTFKYTYGFTTAGPLGYFHKHERATYGDILLSNNQKIQTSTGDITIANGAGKVLEDANGLIRNIADNSIFTIPSPDPLHPITITPHPDKYPLTSLRRYIDYNRSYPNADGNLLSAKPLFYKDDSTQIQLFFNKAYATHFFNKWEEYNGIKADGRMKIVIKDPVEGIDIINPPFLNYDSTITNIPQTEEVWVVDENPQIPFAISQYANLLSANKCVGNIRITKPASKYIQVTPKDLKPSKLYTAIVNNMYDVDHNGELKDTAVVKETCEVHKFVFKTSRYETFKKQIESYYLASTINGEVAEKEAIFKISKAFSTEEINAAYNTIVGQPVTGFDTNILDNLNNNYQHPFDRVFEGILGFSPLDEAISTEINVIRDSNNNKIIAVLVRNPEPFNNPKIPLDVIQDTLQVLSGATVNASYKVLFSKDYSQAIIMNDSKEITENLSLRFKYKIWDGTNFIVQNVDTNGHVINVNKNVGLVEIDNIAVLNN